MQQAGYSQKPLATKLGIKPGALITVINAPENYLQILGDLPDGVTFHHELANDLPFIHYFVTQRAELETRFAELRAALAPTGMLWISWPKRTAKLPPELKISSDLDENMIREIGLAHGLVDVKVAAVDFVWSGLKFVYRLKDR